MEIVSRKISPRKLGRVAEVFGGLSYPIRLKILELLEDGKPYSVGAIRSYVNIEPTLLSHHLKKMKNIGIVDSHRQGRNIYYKLTLMEITKVFDCIYGCKI